MDTLIHPTNSYSQRGADGLDRFCAIWVGTGYYATADSVCYAGLSKRNFGSIHSATDGCREQSTCVRWGTSFDFDRGCFLNPKSSEQEN